MSLSVPSVNYTYAAGAIGFEPIGVSAKIAANSSLREIYDAYDDLFAKYANIHTTLLGQMNAVLSLLGGQERTYSGELDISSIFDGNELIDTQNMQQGECKEGAKAYKYYLKEVAMQLNSLYSWNKSAKATLAQLEPLIQESSRDYNVEAQHLITQLEIADQYAQDAIKAFTQHVVVKKLTVNTNVVYNDGISIKSDDSQETYQAYESEYDGVLSESKNEDGTTTYTYVSKLPESGLEGNGLAALREIETTKLTVTREIAISYYKDGTLADKYDDLAQKITDIQDKNISETSSTIILFDELPLLDKLMYIILYYKYAKKADEDIYVYPHDATVGFPCVRPEKNKSLIDDTNELGQLEMFYIGYLVDRDGPVNALASFMEVKSVAIQAQIVLMSYRVKALQYYIKLLNKGLEALNKSQSSKWEDEPNPIPRSSYNILRYLGANISRSLLYFKDDNGNFLFNDRQDLQQPYLVIQWVGDSGSEAASNDVQGHFTSKNNYIIVEASDEGINSFLTSNGLNSDSSFDYVFKDPFLSREYEYTYIKNFENLPKSGVCSKILIKKGSSSLLPISDTLVEAPTQCFFLHFEDTEATNNEISKTYLPKELEVTRYDVGTAIEAPNGCKNWNGTGEWEEEIDKKSVWTTYVNKWTSAYDTVTSNYQSQLEYCQKSISTLRKKVDTFDSMSSNFRNKAHTIYNKIVNKIN